MKVFTHGGRPGGSRGSAGPVPARPWFEAIARIRCLVAHLVCAWGEPPNAGAAR